MWLDTTADRMSRAIVPVSRGLNSAGSTLALAMVFFITANVLSRALFRAPLLGVVELEEVMLTLMVFAGMAFTQIEKQHIDIDFFTSRLTPAGRNLLACATLFLCTLLYGALGWQSLDMGWTYYLKGMATMQVRIPLWPVMLVIGAGFILLALATLRDTLLALSQAGKDGLGQWAAFALAGGLERGRGGPVLGQAPGIGGPGGDPVHRYAHRRGPGFPGRPGHGPAL
jgi:TRAP-type C4-dicarboxylate transport system permease small subunit